VINNLVSRCSQSPVAPATGSGQFIPARVRPQTSQTYYHRNQQYSIVGLTNAAGTLVERYTYSAYGTLGIYAANGTVRSSSTYGNRYTYTGREYDADLNLYHFRARWYDPSTGGFISRDPLGYVDGLSLYRGYFGVRGVDPHGLQDLTATDWLIKLVLAVARLGTYSPCLAKATGMDVLIKDLAELLGKVSVSTFNIFGGGAANSSGYVITIANPKEVTDSTLLHELIHVYDYHNGMNLPFRKRLEDIPNLSFMTRINKAERLAYGAEYIFEKYAILATLESNMAGDWKTRGLDCDTVRNEFKGFFELDITKATYPYTGAYGFEFKANITDFMIVSGQLGLNFACERIRPCLEAASGCKIPCPNEIEPDSCIYSLIMIGE